MYRYIKASFDNDIPDWLRNDKSALAALNKAGVDLKNATFSEDRVGKTGENFTVYLVNGTRYGDSYRPFVWIPGVYNDSQYVTGPSEYNYRAGRSIPKSMSIKYIAKKDLNIADIIYINKASNAKQPKDRYVDPRNFNTKYQSGYAGQYYKEPRTDWLGEETPGQWITPSGRDKSGYEIPNPRQRLKDFYRTEAGANRRYNKVKSQLDGIYSQLKTVKSRLALMTPNGEDLGDRDSYRTIGRAYDYFSDAIEYYNAALDYIKDYEDLGYEAGGSFAVNQALGDLERCQYRIDDINKMTSK